MRNIVCVNAGNFCDRGTEYVNILFDSIARNTTFEDCKYICFTDNPEGLLKGIEARPLPGDLRGWWNKLYLFSKEAGLEGQTFFFDLDTLIISNIDEYLSYTGKFATLRDFYRKDGLGSGLMSWNGHTGIWERFCEAGKPEIEGGDQAFIESSGIEAERLQDLYKGIHSFKQEDCERWPPLKSKIICFHGLPRPHQVKGSWVELIWRLGGAAERPENPGTMNTSLDKVIENMTSNCKLQLPWFISKPINRKTLCIVGGAPSLKDNLGELRKRIDLGAHVMSVNGTLKYLLSVGIKPDFHCQFDARPDNAAFIEDAPEGITYFIGSMSHPSVFEKLKGKDVIVWHGGFDMEEMQKILEPYQYKPIIIIGGGKTVAMRCMFIGNHLGYKKQVLFGVDSCFAETTHHAYSQPLNDKDGRFDVWADGKRYECAPWMYSQAENFKVIHQMLTGQGCSVSVIGEGLIPDICAHFNRSQPEQKVV